jgi:hypothetical protein
MKRFPGAQPADGPQDEELDRLCLRTCEVTGTRNERVADRLIVQIANALVSRGFAPDDPEGFKTSIAMIEAMGPRNLTESMLCGNMIATRETALLLLRRVATADPAATDVEGNIRAAAALLNLFNEQLQVWQALRGSSGLGLAPTEHEEL